MNIAANIAFSELSRREAEPTLPSPSALRTATARAGRIVTLASLSQTIPDQLIGNSLARFAHSETNQSVLLVRIGAGKSVVSLRDFAAVQPTLNGDFCFAEQLRNGEGGFQTLDTRTS